MWKRDYCGNTIKSANEVKFQLWKRDFCGNTNKLANVMKSKCGKEAIVETQINQQM